MGSWMFYLIVDELQYELDCAADMEMDESELE